MDAPLAVRMRPRTLDEFVGQEGLLGPGKLLRRAVEADCLPSMILWGPPGSGKTSLGHVVAASTGARFEFLSGALDGVAEIRKAVAAARERRARGERTVLFVDEIHRWAKNVQDALLPWIEEGVCVLIGATVENPMFALNPGLRSRVRLFRLEPLTEGHLLELLRRALADAERGLASLRPRVDEAALNHIARMADGDARAALNALELAVLTAPRDETGAPVVTVAVVEEVVQQRAVSYDRSGDQHYDVTSAFIKSMRGSDPDATLYWLARMLYAGEDPRFIARRIMIHAAEDVGLADPGALQVAAAAAQAVERVGLPDGRFSLAEAALYVALAPKSNAVKEGIDAALEAVARMPADPVPAHLRDASYRGAAALGHGRGYRYPHDYPGGRVDQQYLPDRLRHAKFYRPKS
ncbi:MAG: replication-associated recombination protein A [Firmicutes bacterium]|nr:replication-associated recombination protein A [Bacillota bacterium]